MAKLPTERRAYRKATSKMWSRGSVIWAVLLLTLIVPAAPSLAQKPRRAPRFPRPHPAQPVRRLPAARDHHQHPPGFFKQLRELPPDEQERVLANDQKFHQLPPERQQQIRDNLRRWNSLNAGQKETLKQREEILEGMTPEQRQRLQSVLPQWRSLPPARRQAVMQGFRRLKNMPPGNRQRFLSSSQFQRNFSPQEQEILRSFSGLLP